MLRLKILLAGVVSCALTGCLPDDDGTDPSLALIGEPAARPETPTAPVPGGVVAQHGFTPTSEQVAPGTSSDRVVSNPDGTLELAAVGSGLDEQSFLAGPIPLAPSGEPDVVGAFRFFCAPSHLLYDDPIIMPGRPGEFHLHQFFGNTEANAHSTYESLRKTGDSTCVNALNRSAYWQPAMLQKLDDGSMQVVMPDYHSIYYKRHPASDPLFSEVGNIAKDIPRGLRFVFGWQPGDTRPAATFKCLSPDGNEGRAGISRTGATV